MKNRIYIFDWDDNILHMPTKIKIKHKKYDIWEDIELSTAEFAKIRHNPDYLMNEESLNNFTNDESFINDIDIALNSLENLGPSFNKFKECLIYGNSFAIITARGHNPNIFATAIHNLMFKTLNNHELLTISKNIIIKYGSLMEYFKKQKIYCVNSDNFNNEFNTDNNQASEIKKTMALESYISTRLSDSNDFDISAKISVGFSDDDVRNVMAVEEFIKSKLSDTHPDIHFVVYDTSNKDQIIKKTI